MRIKQISIHGLFGIFDHVIPLNLCDRITIIHGPNGFGKTVVLRVLNALFEGAYTILAEIPFREFCVEFDNGNSLEIIKDAENLENNNITINFYKPGVKESISFIKKLRISPKWLKELKLEIQIRLIESQRLLNINSMRNADFSQNYTLSPMVSACSRDLAILMRNKLADYGKISQSLDRTFPSRAVQQQAFLELTNEQLYDQFNQLEATRTRLIEVGLLDRDGDSDFQIQSRSIDAGTRKFLSVYVQDVEAKLSIFEDIGKRMDLLRRIVNQKFSYSYKEISFDKEEGFVFTTSLGNSKVLSPTVLSSGEQHELVLLYELLFRVQPGSLVLIDEPELSLHVGWQVQFLKDLQEITELANLDILMATHSPDIIQDRWDLTVELQGSKK
jgi:predicted ATP-dependent endonuclease of OLD family